MRYVIIGNSAAGIGGVEGIRRLDRENPILLISDEPYHTYSRPLISYYLAGIRDEESMLYRPKDFYETHGVETMLHTKVIKVNTRHRQLVLADGRRVPYDKLLIATGGKPFVPPIEGADQAGVYQFLKLDDAKALKAVARPGTRAVVIGGGLIGLKVAEGLMKRQVAVTVVDLAPHLLSSILDSDGAALVQNHLERHGLTFKLGLTARSIRSEGETKVVTLTSGEELRADFLVIAVGVVPNKDLVEGSAIQVNRGILTDRRLATSVPGVYAAGDVAENYDVLLAQNRVIPILPNAYEQGLVAGINMAGGDAVYPGGFAKNAIGFLGLTLVTAGVVKGDPPAYEEFSSRPAEDQYLKVILNDGKLVGFARINAVDRAGILTGLMLNRVDVSELVPQLLTPDLSLLSLPPDLWRSRLEGAVVQWSD